MVWITPVLAQESPIPLIGTGKTIQTLKPATATKNKKTDAPKRRAPQNAPVPEYNYNIFQSEQSPKLGSEFHDGIFQIGRGVGHMIFGKPKGKTSPTTQTKQVPPAQLRAWPHKFAIGQKA